LKLCCIHVFVIKIFLKLKWQSGNPRFKFSVVFSLNESKVLICIDARRMCDNIKVRNKFICGIKLFVPLYWRKRGRNREVKLFAKLCWRKLEVNCLKCASVYIAVRNKISTGYLRCQVKCTVLLERPQGHYYCDRDKQTIATDREDKYDACTISSRLTRFTFMPEKWSHVLGDQMILNMILGKASNNIWK
jgi:hypothetical protein